MYALNDPLSVKTIADLNFVSRSPLWRGFLVVSLTLVCFALSPPGRAVLPPPDGGYPGANTAEGDDALFSLTTGVSNTAIGFQALFSNTEGTGNTATGSFSLWSNTTGQENTATGYGALFRNTTGQQNTANGWRALVNNTKGSHNTAIGQN